jgi:hypothetical protein
VNDDPVDEEESFALSIEPDGDTFSVDVADGGERTYERTEPETATATVGPLRSLGSLALTLIGIGGLLVLGSAKHRDVLAPPEGERARLAVAREREEFDDWISSGSLPAPLLDRPRVEIDSLEDLVDVAIDSDRRVIEDRDRGAFFVADGELLYRYDPPTGESADTGRASAE